MSRYLLNQLLDIERELVVGDEKGQAPKTLARIRKMSDELANKINREEEKQMIANTLEKTKHWGVSQ